MLHQGRQGAQGCIDGCLAWQGGLRIYWALIPLRWLRRHPVSEASTLLRRGSQPPLLPSRHSCASHLGVTPAGLSVLLPSLAWYTTAFAAMLAVLHDLCRRTFAWLAVLDGGYSSATSVRISTSATSRGCIEWLCKPAAAVACLQSSILIPCHAPALAE